uniref:AAA ATPase AAA+ lid domain-containing protein n=1 Tax=Hucho hucho TaxID=62062 RepID=A0A4W5LQY3_9TELE
MFCFYPSSPKPTYIFFLRLPILSNAILNSNLSNIPIVFRGSLKVLCVNMWMMLSCVVTLFPDVPLLCLLGYCGADMKAVCAEAALCALRRRYPQIYSSSQKLVLDVASISIGSRDFLSAMRKTVPASQRAVSSPAKALTPVVQPLLGAALQTVLGTVSRLFPHAEQGLRRDKRDNGVLPAGVLDDGLLHSEDEDSSVCINGLSHKAKAAGGFLHFSRWVTGCPAHRNLYPKCVFLPLLPEVCTGNL